jgi:predicted dinucleotide-binding enzyme
MRIGAIGAGGMGRTLARHLATLGHQVSISNARGPASLTALAAEIGATPVSVIDGARAAEVVRRLVAERAHARRVQQKRGR